MLRFKLFLLIFFQVNTCVASDVFQFLPKDVIVLILSHLNVNDHLNVFPLCRKFGGKNGVYQVDGANNNIKIIKDHKLGLLIDKFVKSYPETNYLEIVSKKYYDQLAIFTKKNMENIIEQTELKNTKSERQYLLRRLALKTVIYTALFNASGKKTSEKDQLSQIELVAFKLLGKCRTVENYYSDEEWLKLSYAFISFINLTKLTKSKEIDFIKTKIWYKIVMAYNFDDFVLSVDKIIDRLLHIKEYNEEVFGQIGIGNGKKTFIQSLSSDPLISRFFSINNSIKVKFGHLFKPGLEIIKTVLEESDKHLN